MRKQSKGLSRGHPMDRHGKDGFIPCPVPCALFLVLCLLFLPVLALRAGPALAVECPSTRTGFYTEAPSLEDACNPDPEEGDIQLDMPCGGKMILRPVCVPVEGFFEDFQFNPGCEDCGRPDMGYMEGKRRRFLAGAFTLEDLPQSWRSKITTLAENGGGLCPGPGSETGMGLYVFMGKYEVSNFQWKAVMSGQCPEPENTLGPDDARPKTDISWFEALEFTRRYTEWLLKNAPDTLPSFSRGRPAYIRLPTEDEWEYAARGGARVSESSLNHEAFFPLEGRPLSDYAVFTSGEGIAPPEKPAWIGSKCSNPLGLFDTAGNVGEMVLDPFRFVVDDRLHGAAGGFVAKGGSYLKGKVEIMPGRREEIPFFLKDGAYRSVDLGFRILLSGILTPEERSTVLMQQWKTTGIVSPQAEVILPPPPSPEPEIDQSKDPVSELERVAAEVQSDAERTNLLFLRDTIKQQDLLLQKQIEETFKANIWGAVLTAESVSKYDVLRNLVRTELEEMEKTKMETVPEAVLESLESDMTKARGKLVIYDEAVDYFLTSYLKRVRACRKYPEDFFEREMGLISQELNTEGDLKYSLKLRLNLFKRHVSLWRDRDEEMDPDMVLNEITSTYTR